MSEEATVRPRNYSRWRTGCLILVYVLFAAHITHWKLAGKTLAPLELNEVMYTLELGIVTAGFIFMAVAFLSAAIFGRFFCSWGCHILALEDLCAWLLGKVGIRPKPVRSRVLLLVPPAALFYMFIWPQIARLMRGDPAPGLHLWTDAEGWASFVTTDFWRNLPGPGITFLTFAICGFAIVYILGSRSFCLYGCPYGVVFALADRIAPGRIIAKGDCQQCGYCTAICQSHVRIHEEIARYGAVVDPACLKDLDCVSECPNQALGYGFTRPSLLRSFTGVGRRGLRYDFSLGEDALMVVVFLATLLIYRGLYHLVPFLMILGLGGIFAYLAVVTLRVMRRPHVRLSSLQLKIEGRLTDWGKVFVACMVGLVVFSAHSAFIRYHEFQGDRGLERIQASLSVPPGRPEAGLINQTRRHLLLVERWGLFGSPALDGALAGIYQFADPPTKAEPYLRRLLAREPDDQEARLRLAQVLWRTGRVAEVRHELEQVAGAERISGHGTAHLPHVRARALEMLGSLSAAQGNAAEAMNAYERALREDPNRISAHLALAELCGDSGRLDEAERHLRAALAQRRDARVLYNLGVVLTMLGRIDEAIEVYREAAAMDREDPEVRNNLGRLLAQAGALEEAEEVLEEAIRLRPGSADPYFNLARALDRLGRAEEAAERYRQAARLDGRYEHLVPGTPLTSPDDG